MLITSVWFSNRNEPSAVQPNTTKELAEDCLLESEISCLFLSLSSKYTDNERNVIDDALHADIERGA